MFDLPGSLGTFVNFLTIVLGFGTIVFIHELGHFMAAKWAGIRVLAFSIGFGNVLCSYRKGIGFRRGSSDAEYRKLIYGSASDESDADQDQAKLDISPTEYRLSMLPLGGYVKMLGQEDLNPEATSDAPDSYQNSPVGKRMVVICAGVVMNLIMAAGLFIFVFMVGLKSMPPKVGYVAAGSPAQLAQSLDDSIADGLMRGDRIVSINSKTVYSFEDILPEVAMASESKPILVEIERPGIASTLAFEAIPTKSAYSGLLDIGITPSISTVLKPSTPETQATWDMIASSYQLGGLEPGDRVVLINGEPIDSPFDIVDQAAESLGQPITLDIERGVDQKTLVSHVIHPVPALQVDIAQVGEDQQGTAHILGLSGVLMVNPNASQEMTKQGLMPGDIFARVGNVEFPAIGQGIQIIQSNAGESLDLVVLRKNDQGSTERVSLTVDVSAQGSVGFFPANSADYTNLISEPQQFLRPDDITDDSTGELTNIDLPGSALIEFPGSRITKVGTYAIANLRDVQRGILDASTNIEPNELGEITIPVTLELPLPVQPDGSIPSAIIQWTLSATDIEQVQALGWTVPGSIAMVDMFEYEQAIDKADGPVDAVSRGMSKSRSVMIQTYLTFVRLFEGTVQVKHLKGPVGIAHLGTQIASQGFIWVLFFMALISINLAVINFLPLPIVDGGQFLMLVYEWVRGKPVPIVFQNVTTLAGLAFIGSIFLFVTFNDIKAVFGL